MRAEFDQNGLPQGYARILLTREDTDTVFYAPGDSIAVGKATGSEAFEYLCRAGGGKWSGRPEPLMQEQAPRFLGNSVEFILQPAYVDSMEDAPYEVCLIGADGSIKGKTASMTAYDISWSGLDPTSNLPKSLEDDSPVSTASPVDTTDIPDEAPTGEQGDGGEDRNQPLSGMEEGTQAAKVEKKSGKGLLVGLVVAVLLAAGAAAFVLTGNNSKDGTESALQAQEAQQAAEEAAKVEAEKKAAEEAAKAEAEKKAAEEAAKVEAEKKAAEEAAKAEAEKKAAEEAAKAEAEKKAAEAAAKAEAEKQAAEEAASRADARGQVAAFFAGKRDPVAAMELAGRLDAETAEQQDALFRLFYYAASEGNPQGAQRYAECLDPSRPAWGSIRKDGAEAWHAYGQAPNAESARASLKEWTQQAAEKGDATAAEWLKQMK